MTANTKSTRIVGLASRTESSRFTSLKSTLAMQETESLRKTTRAQPIPASLKKDVTVKLNAGAIMREEKHFRSAMEAEKKRMKDLEAGAFDEEAFISWDLEQQAKEDQERMDEIEMNHLNGLISREEAVLAKQRAIDEKAADVVETKLQTEARMKVYIADKVKLGEMNRKLVEDTAELYERVYEAKVKATGEKAADAKAVAAQSKRLLEEAAAREAIENEKRAEIIRQIRALDSTPVDRAKIVDLSEIAGHRVLGEMSIAELRERLAMTKARVAREEADRREQIGREKKDAQRQLQRKIQTIAVGRSQRTTNPKLSDVRAKNAAAASKTKNTKLDAMRAKLAEKRAAATRTRATARA